MDASAASLGFGLLRTLVRLSVLPVTLFLFLALMRSVDAYARFVTGGAIADWTPYVPTAPETPAWVVQWAPVAWAWQRAPAVEPSDLLGPGTQAALGLLLARELLRSTADYLDRRALEPQYAMYVFLQEGRHRWYQRPVGMSAIGVFVAVVAGFLNSQFGWT